MTFIDDVLAGATQPQDINDYIDRWHNAPDDSPESRQELHEFLGMSWDEYQQWSGEPQSLESVIRRKGYVAPFSVEDARTKAYKKQTGRKRLTDAQWRRYKKKAWRDEKRETPS